MYSFLFFSLLNYRKIRRRLFPPFLYILTLSFTLVYSSPGFFFYVSSRLYRLFRYIAVSIAHSSCPNSTSFSDYCYRKDDFDFSDILDLLTDSSSSLYWILVVCIQFFLCLFSNYPVSDYRTNFLRFTVFVGRLYHLVYCLVLYFTTLLPALL